MRHGYENLTAGRVVDTIVPGVYTPDRFSAELTREGFRETSLNLGGDLIDERFCRRNVDQNTIMVILKHLFHRVEPKQKAI